MFHRDCQVDGARLSHRPRLVCFQTIHPQGHGRFAGDAHQRFGNHGLDVISNDVDSLSVNGHYGGHEVLEQIASNGSTFLKQFRAVFTRSLDHR